MIGKTAIISALLASALCIPVISISAGGCQDPNHKPCENMDNLPQEIVSELSAPQKNCSLDCKFNKAVEVMDDVIDSAPPKTAKFWMGLLAIARDEPNRKNKSGLSGEITPTEAKQLLIVYVKNYYYVDGVSGFRWANQKTVSENRILSDFMDCASRVYFAEGEYKEACDYFKAEMDDYNAALKVSKPSWKTSIKPKRKRGPTDQNIASKMKSSSALNE